MLESQDSSFLVRAVATKVRRPFARHVGGASSKMLATVDFEPFESQIESMRC